MIDFVKKKRSNREKCSKTLGFSENDTFINNFIAQKSVLFCVQDLYTEYMQCVYIGYFPFKVKINFRNYKL